MPPSSTGSKASVDLTVTSAVPLGSYPVEVELTNDHVPLERNSCIVNVNVQNLPPVTLTIPQIQGSGPTSTNLGVQTADGVVTKVVDTGFFLQDPAGDGNDATADGIFVYVGATPCSVAEGDAVRVTGTVTEFQLTGRRVRSPKSRMRRACWCATAARASPPPTSPCPTPTSAATTACWCTSTRR